MITENTVYSDEVTIDAPIELVWQILLDFASYPEWNSFCPSIKNDSLELGSPIEMMVDLGHGPSPQVEYICRVDPMECIAWAMENKPEDPIHAVRSQFLKRIDSNHCSYITVDEFAGPEVGAMMDAFAAAVEKGFNQCAVDLKARAEQLHKSHS